MPRGEPFDSSNPDHIKAGKRKDKFVEEQQTADLRAVWSSAEGRRVMWNILSRSGVHRISYKVGSPTSQLDTVFLEGCRNIGLSILDDVMKVCPDMYFLAQKEANKKEPDSE